MKETNIEDQIQKLINDAYSEVNSANPDPLRIDKLDSQLTAINASVGQIYRTKEFEANKWKQYGKDIIEIARSLRRVHETLNTERRITN